MRIFALSIPLLLGGCQASAPDPRGVKGNETLLTVSASGKAETRPDEARLQLGVQSIAPTADEASRGNREKMERVSAALSRLGVKPDDLQTRNLSLNRIDYGRDKGRFRAENIVEVTLRDMSRVGDAVTLVTEAGANVLSGPDLRISDREGSTRSAYAAAYRAARSRADAYAGAAGLKVKRVLGIYDGGEYAAPPYLYPRPVSVEQSAAAPPPPVAAAPFNPGVTTSEVRVRVDFALGE
ncbi:SIMPL domain-containing protein [Allosphingosinicella flava]|uniref:SIMPL domain-containing protein n=1 Tax=Allosphingosinicella flava TaxID=2771430 RepID=A0A7T2GL43_9SPHN|nr:SIMPL domain-containing protein [Sphingosinicella flava]QPQ55873.1 SIMPL domain-containing protein [Sphingosinicella flava]